MNGGEIMYNMASKFAKDALQNLTDYCEYIEEQNIRLSKENEKLRDNAYKDQELAELREKYDALVRKAFVLPDEIQKKVDEHSEKYHHYGFNYTFGPCEVGTWYNIKCDRCNCGWEIDEFL